VGKEPTTGTMQKKNFTNTLDSGKKRRANLSACVRKGKEKKTISRRTRKEDLPTSEDEGKTLSGLPRNKKIRHGIELVGGGALELWSRDGSGSRVAAREKKRDYGH